MRNIQTQYLWLQERVGATELTRTKVVGTANPADMLTKLVLRPKRFAGVDREAEERLRAVGAATRRLQPESRTCKKSSPPAPTRRLPQHACNAGIPGRGGPCTVHMRSMLMLGPARNKMNK